MKTILFLALLISVSTFAQIDFQEQIVVDDTNAVMSPRSVITSDIDGDGDMDVLSASYLDDKIAWYENTDGQGLFGSQQVIKKNAKGAKCVFTADIDGDGDMDVLSASYLDDKIAWYENTDGQGLFGSQQVITIDADGASCVFTADIDGDGDMDVLSASMDDNKVAWYENIDGQGNFGSPKILATTVTRIVTVLADDIDGDGDLDILDGGYDDNVGWYENMDGQGNFGPRNTIDIQGASTHFKTIDADGDGDMDVLCAMYWSKKLVWYENLDGLGNFGSRQVIKAGVSYFTSLDVADIDGDNDIDVISSTVNSIVWHENLDGQGTFGEELVIPEENYPFSIFAADIDGDGDLDILSASYYDDKIAWYENTNGFGNFSLQQVLTTKVDRLNNIYCIDVDGDDDNDILFSSNYDNKIGWYKNDGSGGFGTPKIISTEIDRSSFVYAIDIDGDADIDVLSMSLYYVGDFAYSTLAWYENIDGLGNFGSQNSISTDSGVPRYHVADIDGDNDADIVVYYSGQALAPSYLKLFKNVDGQGNFDKTVIGGEEGGWSSRSVFIVDIDNDGDMDVLTASISANIAWYENMDGLGNFDNGYHYIFDDSVNFPGSQSIYAADFDNDGDMDVLSTLINKIIWFENIDGQGNFGPKQTITTDAIWAWSVYAADMDHDGDMDVLSASREDDKIAWYENLDGLGDFGEQQAVSITANGARSVFATDIDGDGKTDIVSASYNDGKIAWYKNTMPDPESEEPTEVTFSIYPNPTTGVLNVRSQADISKIVVNNILGKLVLSNSEKNTINISKLKKGIYIIKTTDQNGKVAVGKVIKE